MKSRLEELGIHIPTDNSYKMKPILEQISQLSETCIRNNDLFPVNMVTELSDPTTGKKYRAKFELEEL